MDRLCLMPESNSRKPETGTFNHFLIRNDRNDSCPLSAAEPCMELLEHFFLRPGLAMVTGQHFTKKGLSIRFENPNNLIAICYCLSGTKRIRFAKNRAGNEPEIIVSGGDRIIIFASNLEGVKQLAPEQYHAMATILIQPSLLNRMIGDATQINNSELGNVLKGESARFLRQDTVPVRAQAVVHQLLHCSFPGYARQLFIKSKALELLSLLIADLVKTTGSGYDKIKLNQNDLEAVQVARSLLVEDLYNTPTVPQLAKRIGMNVLKLKAGFQRTFGLSIRDYLQQYKMERAKLMIEQGDLNVSEVAWQIGYVNVSHFIAAYRKAYGTTPGRYRSEAKPKTAMVTPIRYR